MQMKNPPHPGLSVRHDCLVPLGLSVTDVQFGAKSDRAPIGQDRLIGYANTRAEIWGSIREHTTASEGTGKAWASAAFQTRRAAAGGKLVQTIVQCGANRRQGAQPHRTALDPRPRDRGHRVRQADGPFGSNLAGSSAVPRTAGIVKGFRMPAKRRREGMHGGRRPKSLEGGNRGPWVERRGAMELWGFESRGQSAATSGS